MNKEIIVLHKDKIHEDPPLLSVVLILLDLGWHVRLITCGISHGIKKMLSKRPCEVHELNKSCYGAASPLEKLWQYHNFKVEVNSILNNYPDTLLWIEGASAIMALGNTYKHRKYVLQIHELHENSSRQLRAIGNVISDAQCVFMPEYSRTAIYQLWFNLSKRPTVLPNKPYFVPERKSLDNYASKYENLIAPLSDRKIILYQGYIGTDRDLSAYAKAINALGDEYTFVLLGKDSGALSHYKELAPGLVHIDYIPAPEYLLFTSMAHIGILGYNPISLNHLFCAPNKIFEYSAFGLPMIGNDIPGLYYPLKMYGAGIIVDENNVEDVKNAIQTISSDYQHYSLGSKKLYDSVNNRETIDLALKNIS